MLLGIRCEEERPLTLLFIFYWDVVVFLFVHTAETPAVDILALIFPLASLRKGRF